MSFANPDIELVEAIQEVLSVVGLSAYYAPKNLRLSGGSPDWRSEILRAIRASSAFVPVVTRHSMIRPWVLFESGVAEAESLAYLPARIALVRPEDTLSVPRTADRWIFDLSSRQEVLGLVSRIYDAHLGKTEGVDTETVVNAALTEATSVDRVVRLARRRSVFIAGSLPSDETALERMKVTGTSEALSGAPLLDYISPAT